MTCFLLSLSIGNSLSSNNQPIQHQETKTRVDWSEKPQTTKGVNQRIIPGNREKEERKTKMTKKKKKKKKKKRGSLYVGGGGGKIMQGYLYEA
jgi:hypothetical protein